MARGHDRDNGPASRPLSIIASGPARLTVALVLVAALAWLFGSRLAIDLITVPPWLPPAAGGSLSGGGDRLMAVLETDQLTPEYISAIERITERGADIDGVARVRSVTNTLVLAKNDPFRPIATPAFGTRSTLPVSLSLPERAQAAAASRLGSSDLISPDGKTMSVIAELRPSITGADRVDPAREFRELVDREVKAAGLPATVYLAGDVYTTIAASNSMRFDSYLFVALAVIVPGVAVMVALRRRVPVATLLAAGGAVLLIAAVVTAGTVGVDAAPLPPSHPIAQGNALVDTRLNGTVPIDVEFAGSPDDFRRPEVLQRVDALTNWLRDEYDVQATGLSSTLRGMAGIVTGVDSVPPNPADVATLLTEMDAFDGGVLLHSLVNDDYSRTRLIAYWPNHGQTAIAHMADRFDTIAAALLADTGIAAHLTGRVPATRDAPEALATELGGIGALLLVLAATLGLLGGWARHRLARNEWYDEHWMDDEPAVEPASLFARAFHRLEHHEHHFLRDHHHAEHAHQGDPLPTRSGLTEDDEIEIDHTDDQLDELDELDRLSGFVDFEDFDAFADFEDFDDFEGLVASVNGDDQAGGASAASIASRPASSAAPPAASSTP